MIADIYIVAFTLLLAVDGLGFVIAKHGGRKPSHLDYLHYSVAFLLILPGVILLWAAYIF